MLAVAGQEADLVWLARGMKLDHHGRRTVAPSQARNPANLNTRREKCGHLVQPMERLAEPHRKGFELRLW